MQQRTDPKHDSIAALLVEGTGTQEAENKESKKQNASIWQPPKESQVQPYELLADRELQCSPNPTITQLRENGFFIQPATASAILNDFKRGQIKFVIGQGDNVVTITNEIFREFENTDAYGDDDFLRAKLDTAIVTACQETGEDVAKIKQVLADATQAYHQRCISLLNNVARDMLQTINPSLSSDFEFYQGTLDLSQCKLTSVSRNLVMMGGTEVKATFAAIHGKNAPADSIDAVVEMDLVLPNLEELEGRTKQQIERLAQSQSAAQKISPRHRTLGRQIAGLKSQLDEQKAHPRPQFKVKKVTTQCDYIHDLLKSEKLPDLAIYRHEVYHPTLHNHQQKVCDELKQGHPDLSMAEIQKRAEPIVKKMIIAANESCLVLAAKHHSTKVQVKAAAPDPTTKVRPKPKRPVIQLPVTRQAAQPKSVVKPATPPKTGSILKAAAWATLGVATVGGSIVGGCALVSTAPLAAPLVCGLAAASVPAGISCMSRAHDEFRTAPPISKAIGWGILGAAIGVASWFAAGAALALLSPFITPVGAAAVAGGILTAGASAVLVCAGKAKENFDEYVELNKAKKVAKNKPKLQIDTTHIGAEPDSLSPDSHSPDIDVGPQTPSSRNSIKLSKVSDKRRSEPTDYSPKQHSPIASLGMYARVGAVQQLKEPLMGKPGNMRSQRH